MRVEYLAVMLGSRRVVWWDNFVVMKLAEHLECWLVVHLAARMVSKTVVWREAQLEHWWVAQWAVNLVLLWDKKHAGLRVVRWACHLVAQLAVCWGT